MSFGALRRELGLLDAALYALARAIGAITRGRARLVKYYITVQPVAATELTPARRGRQIEVNEASPAEALALAVERPRAVIEARLRHGGRCLTAHKAGQLVGFQWFTLEDYPEDDVRCLFRLAPGDLCAWDYDIFVLPEFRTQPVFSRLWDRCNALLRQAGVRWSLSRINAFNPGSRKAHERLGAKVIGSAYFVQAGRLQVSVFSSAPYLHVGFRETQRPILHVSRMASQAARISTGCVAA
ncbi:MAG TPA: GNAT family N-acetyltransferase [Steroidobacteraceae bacterium]|nr:GNAT family N-acetyltransferase [Steroidobacteraceae bacterium]